MKKLMLMLLILIFVITGCSKNVDKPTTVEVPEPPVKADEPIEAPVIKEPVREGKISPLSGIYAADDIINQRVVAIMFDNHPRARWQAGLKDAEIVLNFQLKHLIPDT